MFGRVKLDNILLAFDQSNFNQITSRSRNQTLITVVRDTCTTTVPPSPTNVFSYSHSGERHVRYHCTTITHQYIQL